MKKLQFRLRTLLFLTAGLAVLFAVCARWPVEEIVPQTFIGPNGKTMHVYAGIERPPAVREWLIRVAVSGAAVVIAIPVVVIFFRGVSASLPTRRTGEKDRSN